MKIDAPTITDLANMQHFAAGVVAPSDDYSTEDARVQAICKATRAKAVVDAYKAAQAEQVAPS